MTEARKYGTYYVPESERAALLTKAARDNDVPKSDLYFCKECGSGPWHISWGEPCPNCTGAD